MVDSKVIQDQDRLAEIECQYWRTSERHRDSGKIRGRDGGQVEENRSFTMRKQTQKVRAPSD